MTATSAAGKTLATLIATTLTLIGLAAPPTLPPGDLSVPPAVASRLGYHPEQARLPNGRLVQVEPDGGCSWVPDELFGFDFHNACRMHDYGYDLIRVGVLDATRGREGVDRLFLDAMIDGTCAGQGSFWRVQLCRLTAKAMWRVATLMPSPLLSGI